MSIGQSIVIKGNMSASEDLVIAGRVEGEMMTPSLLVAEGSQLAARVAMPGVSGKRMTAQ